MEQAEFVIVTYTRKSVWSYVRNALWRYQYRARRTAIRKLALRVRRITK